MTKIQIALCLAVLLVASTTLCAQTWSFTGSMLQTRIYPTATLLPNGQVLIVGGYHRGTTGIAQAEQYNPTTGTFSATGSLNTGRYSATATLLNNGKVLIAEGQNSGPLASAELYDPAAGTFTVTGSLSCACGRVPTLLPNGMVLFSGGFDATTGTALSTAELYNPATGTFSPTGNLKVARAGPSSTLLPNGKVLIAGGVFYTGTPPYNLVVHYLASAEIYDPASGTFSLTGSLNTARSSQSTTVLGNGKVLLAAGQNDGANGGYLGPAELYDPSTGKFTFTGSLNTPRQGHASALLQNGQVLAAGGYESQLGSRLGYLASAELFH